VAKLALVGVEIASIHDSTCQQQVACVSRAVEAYAAYALRAWLATDHCISQTCEVVSVAVQDQGTADDSAPEIPRTADTTRPVPEARCERV
jgi:hypothetical protein